MGSDQVRRVSELATARPGDVPDDPRDAPSAEIVADRLERARPTLLGPPVHQPLDGAFGRRSPPTRGDPSWRGPPPLDLAEIAAIAGAASGAQRRWRAYERRTIEEAGDRAVLVPWGAFVPERDPVVLINGLGGTCVDLAVVADALSSSGRQVFLLLYDDRRRLPRESAVELAAALMALRQEHYPPGTRLDLVGHSMGGIVARAALNLLQDPSWLGGSGAAPTPRAGFGPVRLRSIETPWDGATMKLSRPAFLAWLARLLTKLLGWRAVVDLRADGQLMQSLHAVPLAEVDFENYEARESAKGVAPAFVRGSLRRLRDLERRELESIATFILDGVLPDQLRARNLARALTTDRRFAELRQELRTKVAEGHTELAAALIAAHASAMPAFPGNHQSIVNGGDEPFEGADTLIAHLAVTLD